MRLRLIDKYSQESGAGGIDIVLEEITPSDQFSTESYESPFTNNFRKALDWYFTDYPQIPVEQTDDKGVVEKLIKFGQYLGDQLLGENHELYRVTQKIEEMGYQHLSVRFESSRLSFFDDVWESLILPDSKYVLASVAKSFTRKFTGIEQKQNFNELEYGLGVTPPIAETIAGLNQEDSSKPVEVNKSNDMPLKVLHVIYRPESEFVSRLSNAINSSFEMFTTEGAVSYEILPIVSWGELTERLARDSSQVHILHIDSPLSVHQETLCFGLTANQSIQTHFAVTALVDAMAENKIPVLCVDSYFTAVNDHKNGQSNVARQHLAKIARIAEQRGVGNVIGLGQNVDPWLSGECFKRLYSFITKGFNLEQAVVETRKSLQSCVEISTFTSEARPFQYWSLLQHYGEQPVLFFDTPQASSSLEESQTLLKTRQQLHGFKSQLLTLPLNNVSDQQITDLIRCFHHGNEVLYLRGSPGMGKTHLTHTFALYLAQTKNIDFGFYFDCSAEYYSVEIILEMIAPILASPSSDKKVVKQALLKNKCLFILDNLVAKPFESDEVDTGSWRALNVFLSDLASSGHCVVMTGDTEKHDLLTVGGEQLSCPTTQIEMQVLSSLEQKVLVADVLRSHGLSGKDSEESWEDLLQYLQGNPFLITQVLPLLADYDVSSLTEELKIEMSSAIVQGGAVFSGTDVAGKKMSAAVGTVNVVSAFYEWRWKHLPTVWQKFLLLSSSVDGLLLEMLMIACDQKEPFEPAVKLLKILGVEADSKVSDCIDIWEKSGFATRLPHGRIVDSRADSFLEKKRSASENDDLNDDVIQMLFSQVLCEGIKLLSLHVTKQQNPALTHTLLMNRRHWVSHFERLWFASDFRGFMAVRNAFSSLMMQAKLGEEMSAWSLDLLSRSPDTSIADDTNTETKLSWLSLAILALDQDLATAEPKITSGVMSWEIWLDSLSDQVNKGQLSLVHQATVFLELYFQKTQQYEKSIKLAQKAQCIYRNQEAWHWVIQTLKTLTKTNLQLGHVDEALRNEQQIIDEIPYDNSPPGFEVQQLVELVLARLSREDTVNAQLLLDRINDRDDINPVVDTLTGFQAEIDLQRKEYIKAMPYYCRMWMRAVKLEQTAHLNQLKQLFATIEMELGKTLFDQFFAHTITEEAGDNVIHPRDFASEYTS